MLEKSIVYNNIEAIEEAKVLMENKGDDVLKEKGLLEKPIKVVISVPYEILEKLPKIKYNDAHKKEKIIGYV